jgi:hypothetical protein
VKSGCASEWDGWGRISAEARRRCLCSSVDGPDGDCSIVSARTQTEAIERLDEVANAEGCPITQLSHLQLHFTLTDEGRLALEGMGEATEDEIFEFCYPELDHALAIGSDVASSLNRERDRVRITDEAVLKAPETELGQTAKRQLDMPTTLVDRIVSTAAKQRLKSFKPRGNPS